MDSIFNKFGLFDFLGIWWPGVLTLFYFDLTLHNWFVTLIKDKILFLPAFGDMYAFIALYTAGGYFVGVILHELGKISFEYSERFHPKHAVMPRPSDSSDIKCNNCADMVRREHEEILSSVYSSDTLTVDHYFAARAWLKYSGKSNSGGCDKYHSVYAFSRSMFLCFIIHIGFLIIEILNQQICRASNAVLLFLDIALAILFWLRAYRYYLSFIRNTLIQFHVASSKLLKLRVRRRSP